MKPYLFFLGILMVLPNWSIESVKKDLWVIEEDSQLIISGRSNINTFECSMGNLGRKDTVLVTKDSFSGIMQFEKCLISLDTKQFSCGDNLITRDFYHTLKADKYPFINIELNHLNLDGESVWISEKIEGEMLIGIAGRKKKIIVEFFPEPSGTNSIYLKGNVNLMFSDFGLEVPEKLFGLIKVEESIKAEFTLKLTHLKENV